MKTIAMYTVDAFSSVPFQGNTCAVCIFDAWPEDALLQNIAKQNLFAETAFLLIKPDHNPELRWFTVSQEVDFCGYGTLSAAFVYKQHMSLPSQTITFDTRNYGPVSVTQDNNIFHVHVEPKKTQTCIFDPNVYHALGGPKPVMYKTDRDDLLIAYESAEVVQSITPDFNILMECGYYGYILTAAGDDCDYTYRYFSPRMTNVWEDPVNGASQTVLAPYWANALGKTCLKAKALSERGGDLLCSYNADHNQVSIGGNVCLYQKGHIYLP